jgi:hypothetical protein
LIYNNDVNLHRFQMMHQSKQICLFVFLLLVVAFKANAQLLQPSVIQSQQKIDSLRNLPIQIIPANYYSKNLAFFCKKELQLEKITKVPFRFRLGSVDYVDHLEGKKIKY